jgi:hypothetical protein
MALLNIGFVIIAATYQFLPELTGKALHSESLAKWHVWLTFLLATANSAVWLYQGLLGAPRRFAVLPHTYDGATQAGVGISIALGAAQLLFAYNLVQTLRGKVAEARPARQRLPEAAAEAAIVLMVLGLVAAGTFVGWVVGHYAGRHTSTVTIAGSSTSPTATAGATTTPTTTRGALLGGGNPAAGRPILPPTAAAVTHSRRRAPSARSAQTSTK